MSPASYRTAPPRVEVPLLYGRVSPQANRQRDGAGRLMGRLAACRTATGTQATAAATQTTPDTAIAIWTTLGAATAARTRAAATQAATATQATATARQTERATRTD